MKKELLILALLLLLAGPAFAAITNSAHDLSSGSTYYTTNNADTDELCVYCHTPHAVAAVAFAPLWNRGASLSNATVAYGNPSGSMDSTADLAAANASDAPLCLGCHDGSALTIALNNPPNGLAGADPIAATATAGGNTNIGTDLSNDHPVGMDYADAVPGGEMVALATVQADLTIPLFGVGNDIVWCSSCHDVHNAGTGSPLLQVSNASSALCKKCHDK